MLGQKLYKAKAEDMDIYTQVAEWCNKNNAHIDDKGEYYEVVENTPYVPTVADQIAQLKAELSATDYKCLKFVDGALSEEEYAETKILRANLRQQINDLEAQAE